MSELARLTPLHFRFDDSPPVIVLAASETKNEKPARQPLPTAAATAFREYLSGKPARAPIWPGNWSTQAAKLLRYDLSEAGIPYALDTTDGKKYLDAHSLRHTFTTMLAAAGVGVKELQLLARHSDAMTTLNVYTHVTATGISESLALLDVAGLSGRVTLGSLSLPQLEQFTALLLTVFSTIVSPGVTKSLKLRG